VSSNEANAGGGRDVHQSISHLAQLRHAQLWSCDSGEAYDC
jgi:hypothetical protein